MKVTVNLKDGRSFEFNESAVFEDKEAGRFVLSQGKLTGGRVTNSWTGLADPYAYKDGTHIVYAMRDVLNIQIAGCEG